MRTALPALLAAFIALAPQARAAACHCSRNWWALHRPSTPAEHAQTERLNREFRAASRAPVAPPDAAPPARAAEDAPRSQFEEYRDLRAAYDRQLRAYYRAFPPSQATAPMPPPAPAEPVPR